MRTVVVVGGIIELIEGIGGEVCGFLVFVGGDRSAAKFGHCYAEISH